MNYLLSAIFPQFFEMPPCRMELVIVRTTPGHMTKARKDEVHPSHGKTIRRDLVEHALAYFLRLFRIDVEADREFGI